MDQPISVANKRLDENPAVQHLQEFEESKELNRIIQKNERLTFRIRLKGLRRFVMLGLGLLLLWSASTESLFLFSGFYEMSSSLALSILGVFLVVALLEGGKFFFGSYLLLFLTQGWIKDGWLYRLTFIVLIPICIGLYWGSYYLSVNGAPQIADFIHTNTKQLELVDTDSITQYYDQRIAALQKEISTTKDIKWKGTTTNTATKLALEFQAQVNELEVQKKSDLETANTNNNKRLQKDENKNVNWGLWLSKFGGYGELLTIVFLLFIELYDRASYLELPHQKQKPKQPHNNAQNEEGQAAPSLVQQAVASETEEDQEIQALRTLILEKQVDTRYLKQRAKQCYKRSFKPQSAKEVKQRNLKKAGLFIEQLGKLGIIAQVHPEDQTELIFTKA